VGGGALTRDDDARLTRRQALVALAAAAAAGGWPRRAAARAEAKVRLGYQATLWGAPAIVAEEEKLFAKAGANVEVLRMSSGKDIRDAMVAGQVDIGSLGATPFIVGAAKGDIVAIGMVAYAGKTLAVVAGTHSGIKAVADLRGKRVGSQIGSITDHVFQNVIAPRAGLKKGDFQVFNIKFQDHVAALAARSIDAFAGVDPYPAIAEHDGLGAILVDYQEYDITPVLLAANRPFVKEHPDAVVQFLRGWLLAVKIFREQPDRAAGVVGNAFKTQGYSMSPAVLRKAVARLDVNPDFTPALGPYLTEQAKVLVQQGQLKSLPDWDTVLVREYLQKAMTG
jgi:aliphatic sulfonates family ABC transporter substrate-binding protein